MSSETFSNLSGSNIVVDEVFVLGVGKGSKDEVTKPEPKAVEGKRPAVSRKPSMPSSSSSYTNPLLLIEDFSNAEDKELVEDDEVAFAMTRNVVRSKTTTSLALQVSASCCRCRSRTDKAGI